jgi:hypothetical protein
MTVLKHQAMKAYGEVEVSPLLSTFLNLLIHIDQETAGHIMGLAHGAGEENQYTITGNRTSVVQLVARHFTVAIVALDLCTTYQDHLYEIRSFCGNNSLSTRIMIQRSLVGGY